MLYIIYICIVDSIFYLAPHPNSCLSLLIVKFLHHTQPDTHASGRISLDEWSGSRIGRYLHNTQQTLQTNIHTFRSIRTREPSNQVTSDLRLKPQDHRDRADHMHNCAKFNLAGTFRERNSCVNRRGSNWLLIVNFHAVLVESSYTTIHVSTGVLISP